MKFWQALSFTPTVELVELARVCEDVGFHGVHVADHVFVPERIESIYPYAPGGVPPFTGESEFPEAWATVSAMAAVTSRLRFTTGIYIAPLRHPLIVAKSVATAAVLSGGRVALGAGAGWMREEFDQFGEDFASRGRRLDEMIDVLRAVWRGGAVEHHGEFYDFSRLQQSPPPPSPIPIYIGGASAPALRRAARNDGWIGTGNDPAEVSGVIEQLRDLRKDVGREGEPFETIVAVTEPASPDLFRRLEDEGVTGAVSYPLAYVLSPDASLDDKRAALERYGNDVIAKI